MKILLAADISFNYYDEYPGKESVYNILGETAKEFRKADFSVINLENIFGKKEDYIPIPKGGPNLISPVEFVEFIDALRPTAIGLANNHCFDYSEEALMKTIDLLNEKDYHTFGAGKNIDEAYKSIIFEKDGIKAEIIAVCENEHGTATENTAGAAGYNLARVSAAIKNAADAGHFPIIYFHGGNEFNPMPSPEKTELYRHFIDLGAKAVIGMHTHCPQGYEIYNGAPIVYSMGNFFFPREKGEKLPTWYYGYMCLLEFKNEAVSLDTIPYSFDMDSHRILKYTEKEQFMKYLSYLCKAVTDQKLVKEYFDSWCMMNGIGYLINHLCYTEDMLINAPESIKTIKNILCCEAHNEIVRNTFRIIYDGKVNTASRHIAEIKELQEMHLLFR